MSFIQRELDRIGFALRQTQSGQRYIELYAVQQALAWAVDPSLFKSPTDMIAGFNGTPANLEDCRASLRQDMS